MRRPEAGQRLWYAVSGAQRRQLLQELASGASDQAVGWLPGRGGWLGNLRAWENLILPAAHFGASVDQVLEARVLHGLLRLGYDASASAELLQMPVGELAGETLRRLLALRVALAAPALVMVESEWFARCTPATLASCSQLFDEFLPAASWAAVGAEAPPAGWGFVMAQQQDDDDVAARF